MKYGLIRFIGWIALWALLFRVSRANHPTVALNIAATSLMIIAAIAAFTITMQTTKNRSTARRLGMAAICILGAGVLAALAIHLVYNIAIGPDPRRFGLAANIGMDTVIVAVLVALMGALDWSLGRIGFRNPG